jgi:DNA-directed RNA polymerase specialized sigma subunit
MHPACDGYQISENGFLHQIPLAATTAPKETAEEYSALVSAIARELAAALACNFPAEDLIPAGMAGVPAAIHDFGCSRSGATFAMFLRHRIRGTMLDQVHSIERRRRRKDRRPIVQDFQR